MEHNKDVEGGYVDIASYQPTESEMEKASNSYLMSLIAIIMGAPLPIINLLATFIFFLANRKATPYVKWHCTQALLSQITIFAMNAVAFTWTMRVLFGGLYITDNYIAYIITIFCFNVFEFVITIIAATRVRKGHHIEWWFWGALTNELNGNNIPVKQ